jgi:hypothetical protein
MFQTLSDGNTKQGVPGTGAADAGVRHPIIRTETVSSVADLPRMLTGIGILGGRG